MLFPILSIFVFVAFSPTLSSSTAATASNRTLNCFKYEKKFADVNFIDVPAAEKDVIQCDQCCGYICYENGEYILGYGCREDLFKSCNFTSEMKGLIYEARNKEQCGYAYHSDAIVDLGLKNLSSNHNTLKSCIEDYSHDEPNVSLGPAYTFADITIKEVATPTTTTESALNPENGNGGKSQNGNGGDSGNKNDPNSANSKMISFIFFFGIFIFAYFM